MAGKPKPMSQIKQLLRLHQQGKGIKFIARSLSISKNTVKTYLEKISLSSLDVPSLMGMEDPLLEKKFHPGNPAYKDKRFDHFKEKLDYFEKELKKTGVTKQLLWSEYKSDYPGGYSLSQFYFHLSQQLIARKPSMVLEHLAGEKLFIDFAGKKLSFVDRDTGEVIPCQVFVACLPYSDYSFVLAVRSQGLDDFLYALRCCLEELGGVPKAIVTDNLKSAVVKASTYEPDINRAMEDFANHYGTTVIPARARHPKDKALVEDQVKLIYSRVYARLRNVPFFDLSSLNQSIREKTRDHNQTRMQQKPYSREEKFLADEKHLLKDLPSDPFEIKYYRELKVAKNNHIYLSEDKHYYSVPFAYTGVTVKVIYTRAIVRVYAKGEQIALHVRDYKQGGYTTDKEHLCSSHRHYLDRSPSYYIEKARSRSEILCRLLTLLFDQKRYPEQLYRTCDGLFSLYRRTDEKIFERACAIAIENQKLSYAFVVNIIKNKTTEEVQKADERPLPSHQNTRGKQYYAQLTLNI